MTKLMMKISTDTSGSGGTWRSSTPRLRPFATSGYLKSATRRFASETTTSCVDKPKTRCWRAGSCCERRCSKACAKPSRSHDGGRVMIRVAIFLAAVAAAAAGAGPARAEWPDRPIKMVVPFSAGSSSDTIARIIAAKMGERLGQQIVVENRVGGSTIIGTDSVAKSAPDGYTLQLANTTTHAASAALNATLP